MEQTNQYNTVDDCNSRTNMKNEEAGEGLALGGGNAP